MANRMRFGTSMEILYDNILNNGRNMEDSIVESVQYIRLTYTYFRKSKYDAYETIDENIASKYAIHTLILNEK